ncbi:MAG: PEGA domain-containing protein [Deltaproteobacteria bacterium]|nr:PEGA domain-containing protein [Deltaproteobacteria bacterium]
MSTQPKTLARWLLALLGTPFTATTAVAAPPPAASPATASDPAARADKLAAEATRAVLRNALEEARKLYLESLALKPSAETLGSLGGVEHAMKRYRDCAEHLTASLQGPPSTGGEAARTKNADKLAECRSKVGAVRLEVTPDGTTVTVDGVVAGKTPFPSPLFVEPGARTVTFALDGHRDAQRSVETTAGREVPLIVKLEKPPAPPAARPAKEATTATAAETPPAAPSAPPEPATMPLWPVFAGGAATAVFLGAGVGLYLASNGTESDGDAERAVLAGAGKRCPEDCAALIDTYDSASSQRNAATGLFIGAGVAAAGTVAYYVIAKPGSRASAIAWVPVIDEKGAGLLVRGTF